MPNRGEILKQQFLQTIGTPWSRLLPESRVNEILSQEGIKFRNSIYPPIVVLWMMIFQVLDPDKSLKNAVSRGCIWLKVCGATSSSLDTGGYSKARGRLPEDLLCTLINETAEGLEDQASWSKAWCGRRVRACDGTTVLMSDSPDNQAAYPQHGNQAEGCGFPIAKLVVIFSLATGAAVLACIAPWDVSEIVMSRMLYQELEAEDVIIADSAYGSYVDLALVQKQGADGVFRKHHARLVDFRRGNRAGKRDHQVVWQKPKKRPEQMSEAQFEVLPETMMVREVCLRIEKRGFRSAPIIIVTTLLDAKRYTAEALTELYGLRWQGTEVNLRSLKTLLQMEMIRAKSPTMVRKEIWSHLLAYNLLRTVMLQAARKSKQSVFCYSFQGTRQLFNQFVPALRSLGKSARKQLYQWLLELIIADPLLFRPGRREPRVVKRRPKPFPRMRQPRIVLRAKLVS